ncbi:MAG: hypothetical protein AAGC77_08430 [Pseudomonadota bacterium]
MSGDDILSPKPSAEFAHLLAQFREARGRINYPLARKVFRERMVKGQTVIAGLVAALAASRASAAAAELTDETAIDLASLPMIDSFEDIGIYDGDCVTEEAIAAAIAHVHDAAHDAVFGHHNHNPLSADPFADPFVDPYRSAHGEHADHDHERGDGHGHDQGGHGDHSLYNVDDHAGHENGHSHHHHHNHASRDAEHHGLEHHAAHEASSPDLAHADHGAHGARDPLMTHAHGASDHGSHNASHLGHVGHAALGASNTVDHASHHHQAPIAFGDAEIAELTATDISAPYGAEAEELIPLSSLQSDNNESTPATSVASHQNGHDHAHHQSTHHEHNASVAEEIVLLELDIIDALPQVDGPIFL